MKTSADRSGSTSLVDLPRRSDALGPITERLLRAADVHRGMSVLDICCGHGDVSIIAADLVGPEGHVVGVDSCHDAIRVARSRALVKGRHNIHFAHVDQSCARNPVRFDAVVCRHVLSRQSDPVEFLRATARRVRSGGVLALHEMNLSRGVRSSPPLPLLDSVNAQLAAALESAGVMADAGGRLVDLMDEAGLPTPALFGESLVEAGSGKSVFAMITELMEALTPQLGETGADIPDLRTLENRLRDSALTLRSQVEFVPQVCAWTRIP